MFDRGRLLAACAAVTLLLGVGAPSALASPLGQISEYNGGLFFAGENGRFASAPDGSLWFVDDGTEGFVNGMALDAVIGKVDPTTGVVKEYQQGLNVSAPTGGSLPDGITSGPDGRMWFTDSGNPRAVGAITSTGKITEYTSGMNSGADPIGIATGSNGNLWFADDGTTKAIGTSTSAGQITEYSTGLNPGAAPHEVALGADGNIWFTDDGTTRAIGKITPAGQITEYSLPAGARPLGIAAGADGNVWFTDDGSTPAIGRITTTGQITEYSSGLGANAVPALITSGADGNLWFTDEGATPAIGRIMPAGEISEYSSGLNAGADPVGITPGPGGDLWFTDSASGDPALGQVGDGLPLVTFAWAQTSSITTTTVAENINPGGLPTTYYVEYGTSTAYGSVTPPQDAGDGDTPVTVTVSLGSLPPSTTFHYRFVATNAAGTAFSDDQAITTTPPTPPPTPIPPVFVPTPSVFKPAPPVPVPHPGPLVSLIHPPTVRSTSVLVRLGCGGAPGERCGGEVVLATWERLVGSQVTGLAPRSRRAHRQLVMIGQKGFSIPAGTMGTVKVALNGRGLNLLRRFGRLPAVMQVSQGGARRGTASVVTFSARGS